MLKKSIIIFTVGLYVMLNVMIVSSDLEKPKELDENYKIISNFTGHLGSTEHYIAYSTS